MPVDFELPAATGEAGYVQKTLPDESQRYIDSITGLLLYRKKCCFHTLL